MFLSMCMEAAGQVLQRLNKALSAVEHVFFFEGRAEGQDMKQKQVRGMKTSVTIRILLCCTESSRNAHFLVSASQGEEECFPFLSCEAAQNHGWQARFEVFLLHWRPCHDLALFL